MKLVLIHGVYYLLYCNTLEQLTLVSSVNPFFLPSFIGDRWFHISERPPHLYQISAGKTSVWAREKDGKIWLPSHIQGLYSNNIFKTCTRAHKKGDMRNPLTLYTVNLSPPWGAIKWQQILKI